jgi:hypothetical protein
MSQILSEFSRGFGGFFGQDLEEVAEGRHSAQSVA